MTHRYRIAPACKLAFALLPLPLATARAQEPSASQKLSPALTRPFRQKLDVPSLDAATAQIARGSGVAIITDGDAYPAHFSWDGHGSVANVLDAAAKAYDCEWSRTPGGIVCFRRLFSHGRGRPQASLPELRHTADTILAAFQRLPLGSPEVYNGPNAPDAMMDLPKTFTSQQIQRLQQGDKLHYMDLAPNQQAVLATGLADRLLGTTFWHWSHAVAILDHLNQSRIVAQRTNAQGPPKFDYLLVVPQERAHDYVQGMGMASRAGGAAGASPWPSEVGMP